jgi:hypothetical protein
LIRRLQRVDVRHIARRLRHWDRAEVVGVRGHDYFTSLIDSIMRCTDSYCATYEGRPVAMGGIQDGGNYWQLWMLATDSFPAVGWRVTEFVRSSILPRLADSGKEKAICESIEGHSQAHQWLKLLGARDLGPVPMGLHGEVYRRFQWERDDVLFRRERAAG